MSTSEIESKIRELRQLQSLIEEAQAEAEAIKDTWKPITTTKLDTTALKRALPEVVAQYSKQTTTRRFCVA